MWAIVSTPAGQTALPPARFSTASTSYDLGLPPTGLKQYEVYVLDQKTGLVARKSIGAKEGTTAPIKITAADFNHVHRLKVEVTGQGGRPVASATVAFQDAAGKPLAPPKILDLASAGAVVFESVPVGPAKLIVTPAGGGAVTRDITVQASPSGATVPVALPDVTDVIAAPTPAPATTPEATPPTPSTPAPAPPASAPAPAATPAAPAPAPAPAPSSPSSFPLTLLSLILLGALLYGGYLLAKQRGWTFERVLSQLGVQPLAEPVGTTGRMAAPPPPAPVDPAVCAFCGQRKDPATGRCACSVDTAAPAPFAAPGPTAREGARLIATQGIYMGQIFALTADASIGRDTANAVPLPEDSTVSRRHARITAENGGYHIRDEGSSNGTFVNGARVTEQPLRPGDEVSIGGTRFRFEV